MPSSKDFTSSKKTFSNDLECGFCHKRWGAKGFGNHRRACEKKHLLALQQMEYEKKRDASKSNPTPTATFSGSSHSRSRVVFKPWEHYGRIEPDVRDDKTATAPSNDHSAAREKLKKPQSNIWQPFRSRSEFEFAEVALTASLTKNQVNTLIQLIQRCIHGEDSFNIRDYDHLLTIWNSGADLKTS